MDMGTLADILKFTIGLPLLILYTVLYGILTLVLFVASFIFEATIHYDTLQEYRKDMRSCWSLNNGISTYGLCEEWEGI